MTTPLRIIFAGTPEFAAIHLQTLVDSEHQVIAAYTQPDRPAGRGKKLTASPVKKLAEAQGIPVYQPKSLKDEEQQQMLRELNADVMIVVAYGLILPQAVLDTPKYGCINVHASLLPRWRGAAPIQRAIEAGDEETGVTIMQMDAGLDTGDMLVIRRCLIEQNETAASLHDKLAELGGPALAETLQYISTQSLQPEQQNDSQTCYANKIEKAEALINWQESAATIHRKVRAFNPFPICYTTLDGDRVKVWGASVCDQENPSNQQSALNQQKAVPGTIIEHEKDNLLVACGEGSLELRQLQLPGGKAMAVKDILNSRRDQFGIGQAFGS